MRTLQYMILGAALASPVFAQVPKVPFDTPLIVDGDVKVDAGDVEGILLRVPEERRADFRTSYDRLAGAADSIFVARSLAGKARAAGLDKDPAVQKRLQQVQEELLADLYVQKVVKENRITNLDQRALELYKADQAKFVKPEHVYVQHILINLNGRTKQQALERAAEVARQAKAKPDDFLALAGTYSDDPDMKRNRGDLGFSNVKSFVPPVREALAKMKTKGEVSDPIESEYGYHVFKFIDRQPEAPVKFDVVKPQIVKAERERLENQRRESLVQDVRASPTVTTYRDNVESLVVKIDPDLIKRALERQNAKQ